MGLLKEFREFAIKGNMIDMAVGIIIGTAFNQVVDVLVKQVIMPPLSILTGPVSFSEQKIVLRDAVIRGEEILFEEIAIGYGLFLEVIIDFVIIGFTVFLVVKFMNRFRRRADNPAVKEVQPARNIQLLENLNRLIEEQNDLIKKNGRA